MHMRNEFAENSVDRRDYPTQQEQVPDAFEQKALFIDKIKEQREGLEQINLNMRQKQTLNQGTGPQVSKASLLKVLRDIDNQDKQKALYGMNESQLLIRRHMEAWIK